MSNFKWKTDSELAVELLDIMVYYFLDPEEKKGIDYLDTTAIKVKYMILNSAEPDSGS